MQLILVRHTSLDIAEGLCYGQSDILPSNNFEVEAKQTSETLAKFSIDKVYTSPLKRCTMLAEFCGFENIINDKRLIELNFGDWEMQDWNNIHGKYATQWMENYLTFPTLNGECMQDLVDRMNDFISEIKQSNANKTVLCFTHSGPIRIAEYLINKVSIDKLFDLKINYGGVFEFNI